MYLSFCVFQDCDQLELLREFMKLQKEMMIMLLSMLEGLYLLLKVRFRVMMFNATFNNISVILWQSVLLVEKTTDLSQVTDKLYHIQDSTHNVTGNRY